jgi:hypothetical protein
MQYSIVLSIGRKRHVKKLKVPFRVPNPANEDNVIGFFERKPYEDAKFGFFHLACSN